MITEIIKSIKKDYLPYISNSSLISDDKLKELYLMKRKSKPEFFKPKINHNITFQKDNTFSIINNSKIEDIRQINASKNTLIRKQSDINYIVNNSKNLLKESSNNLKQEENNKPKIIMENKEANLINNSSTIKNHSFK